MRAITLWRAGRGTGSVIDQRSIQQFDKRQLFDADMQDDDSWLALVGDDSADTAVIHDTEFRLNRAFRYPVVRQLGTEGFVVVDRRASSTTDLNGMVFRYDSPSKPISFHAGDGIADLLVTSNFIVTTYFDEGVFGRTPISHDGLAVFDHEGSFQFGYCSRLTARAVRVVDCYAACTITGDDIAFVAYTEFPLVTWNLKTGFHQTTPLPPALHGISAMSADRDEFFLYSPYRTKRALIHYSRGSYKQVAQLDGRMKSIRNGRFLSILESSFSVVDCRRTA